MSAVFNRCKQAQKVGLIVCLFLTQCLTVSCSKLHPHLSQKVDNPVVLEIALKGQGNFLFPNNMSLEEASKLIRRDFPDMIENAQPLPSFADKEMAQLRVHEGATMNNRGEHTSYLDSLDNLTGGIGHLLSEDEQKKYPIGTAIPDSVVSGWFKGDTDKAETQTNSIIKSFALSEAPDEVKQILFNMAFNLGEGSTKDKTGLRGFGKMLGALSRKDHKEAAKQMKDSV